MLTCLLVFPWWRSLVIPIITRTTNGIILCSIVVWRSEDGIWFYKTCFKFPAEPQTICETTNKLCSVCKPWFLEKKRGKYVLQRVSMRQNEIIHRKQRGTWLNKQLLSWPLWLIVLRGEWWNKLDRFCQMIQKHHNHKDSLLFDHPHFWMLFLVSNITNRMANVGQDDGYRHS